MEDGWNRFTGPWWRAGRMACPRGAARSRTSSYGRSLPTCDRCLCRKHWRRMGPHRRRRRHPCLDRRTRIRDGRRLQTRRTTTGRRCRDRVISKTRVVVLAVLFAGASPVPGAARHELVVCADPNNMPFSNRRGEGFENKLAELVAREMGVRLRYVWWAQRRGYVRNTLTAQKCDLWPGVASGLERVLATQPYYRSTYVFVSRADSNLDGLT